MGCCGLTPGPQMVCQGCQDFTVRHFLSSQLVAAHAMCGGKAAVMSWLLFGVLLAVLVQWLLLLVGLLLLLL